MWVRNEGTVWNDIYWNSTLAFVTLEIMDSFQMDTPIWHYVQLNGTRIQPGEIRTVFYAILIPPYTTVGTYNWTVNVWGINYY